MDGDQETCSRLSHQNHSPSLLPWFVTPSGALSSQMPSCGMDTVVRTAAVGYHQPPAGTAIIDIESRTRCASVSNAARRWISCRSRGRYLSYCSFRLIRRSPPGRALASLPWRPARETEAHDHMITWGQLKLAGPNGARAAWLRLRERRDRTHRHGNRVLMSCARCSQKLLISGGHFLYQSPKLSTPYSVIPRYDSYCGYGGAQALRDSGRSLEHDGKAQPAH